MLCSFYSLLLFEKSSYHLNSTAKPERMPQYILIRSKCHQSGFKREAEKGKEKSKQAHFPLQLIRAAVAAAFDDDYVAHVKKLGILLGTFIALRTSDNDGTERSGMERGQDEDTRMLWALRVWHVIRYPNHSNDIEKKTKATEFSCFYSSHFPIVLFIST